MLRINAKPKEDNFPAIENKDIIVTRVKNETSYDKEGNEIKKRTTEKVNLTKKINETAKAIKTLTAEEKLANIQQTLRG